MSRILDCLNDDIIDTYFDSSQNNEEEEIEEEETVHDDNNDNNDNHDNNDIVIGIDFGTVNSVVSIWRNQALEIIPDRYGNRTMPSVVAFTNKSKYIGREAKNQIELNPENTYYEVKRLLGHKIDDETVIQDKEFFTFGLDQDDNKNILLKSNLQSRKKLYTPEEIASMIIMELKHMAEDYLKHPVAKAVVTVPAYFNDGQREAVKNAMEIAGLECLRILCEPTAAALAYGIEKMAQNKGKELKVLVYDLGGGTLDASILNIYDGYFEVVASSGNTHLGGSDFDNKLVNYCMSHFKQKYGYIKLDNLSLISLQRLRKACENAKKILSETKDAIVGVSDFYDDKNLYVKIKRDEFENLCRDLFILCLKSVEDVLHSCDVDRSEIDEVILVGGGTRMPLIRENIKLFFNGKEPNCTINPDEVVSAGAAIQGYILVHSDDPFSENIVILDSIPLSLGVEIIGGIMNVLIPRNTTVPVTKKRKYTTDSDLETSVVVRIFEGERKMTKDNFFVGEFELSGLEPAPRGVAEIGITFHIDINGIINVTAEDLKNTANKRTITITGTKGRLSEEAVKKLVGEAAHMETKDKIERQKKQYYYDVDDICNNILINIKNENFKLNETSIKIVTDDITQVLEWLKATNYTERDPKEYFKVLERIKRKYGTIMMKVTNDQDNVKATLGDVKIEATTVYNDDEDEDEGDEKIIFEQIEEVEAGINKESSEELKKEIKQLRDTLVELCYTIFDIISSKSVNLEEDHRTEIKQYIDDILLWVQIQEKICKSEIQQKMEEINKLCNDIVTKYETVSLFNNDEITIYSKREELYNMCYALLSSILSNSYSLHEEQIESLKNKIQGNIDWLIDEEIEERRAELEDREFNLKLEDIQIRIDEINDLCNKLYQSIVNFY